MAKIKFKPSTTQIIGIICLLLMIATVVTQFLPYWTFDTTSKGDAATVSIFDYVWFPNAKEPVNHKNFIKDMKVQLVDAGLMDAQATELKKLSVNDFAYPHAILMLVSLFGIAFGPFKLGKPLGVAFNLAVGILGVYQYFSHPIYKLGQDWYLGLIFAGVLTVLALLNVVLLIVKKLKD